MQAFISIAKALSEESRVRALMCLRAGELCLCQLIELLGLAPSTVSKHMSILQQAGLIRSRKEGRWHYYRLASRDARPVVRMALRWVTESLAKDPAIAADTQQQQKILRKEKKELCSCYKS